MITLVMIATLLGSAFAADEKVKTEITKAFTSQFSNASEVTWVREINYYKVFFVSNGSWMCAYYNNSAELLAVKRNVSPTQLPYFLQNSYKKTYADHWVTGLFELSTKHGFRYFITLQNADKTIVLESLDGSDWNKHH